MIGYSPREVLLRPDSNLVLESEHGPLVEPERRRRPHRRHRRHRLRGYEVVTKMHDWPAIDVAVKGYVIPGPESSNASRRQRRFGSSQLEAVRCKLHPPAAVAPLIATCSCDLRRSAVWLQVPENELSSRPRNEVQ